MLEIEILRLSPFWPFSIEELFFELKSNPNLFSPVSLCRVAVQMHSNFWSRKATFSDWIEPEAS